MQPGLLVPEPTLTDSRFTVPGIRCAGCIAKIERELGKRAGVAAVRKKP